MLAEKEEMTLSSVPDSPGPLHGSNDIRCAASDKMMLLAGGTTDDKCLHRRRFAVRLGTNSREPRGL